MSPFARTHLAALARKAALICAVGLGFASPTQASIYTEVGDAGQTQGTAQSTLGSGSLTDIFGALSSSQDADLYLIRITNPALFSASTVNATGGFLDTQLFLLSLSGAPLFLNDDEQGGQSTLSRLPMSGGFASLASGLYILGVAMAGYDPVNINNQLLFAAGLSTDVRGAASGLQPAVLGGFFDSTFFPDLGPYDIQLTGASAATIAAVSEPGTSAMLLAGGAFIAFAGVRRRRRASAV